MPCPTRMAIIILHPFDLSWFDGIWIVFIGWFLGSVASASYRQIRWQETLHDFTTLEATTPDRPVVPPETTVS